MLNPFKSTRWGDYLWTTPVWRAMTDGAARISNLPVLGDFFLKILGHDPEHYEVTLIPTNKCLEDQGTSIVPVDLLREYIRRSSHRVILHQCPCRQGNGCQDYPRDLGCLYLGEATKDLDPSFGKHATVDEALAHVERALAAGLMMGIPGQVDLDCLYLGCQPASHFSTVCFCCQCCCVVGRNGHIWSPKVKNLWHKLEGISIEVTDDCVGCEECLDKCFVAALSMEDGKARINQELCKGCGVCVDNCPTNAISIKITDEKKMRECAVQRVENGNFDILSTIPGKKINTEGRDQVPHPRWGHKKVKIHHSRK
jgi:UDP-glucose 4-epimerase